MAVASFASTRGATTPNRSLAKGLRSRCIVRRAGLRRPSRCGPFRRSPTPLFNRQRRELARACDGLDWEERGARAAAEFVHRAIAATERRAAAVAAAAAARKSRHVSFVEAPSIFEVPAYCEIYGLHPREFVFDRNYGMVPAQGPFGFNGFDFSKDEDDEAAQSDDEFDDF